MFRDRDQEEVIEGELVEPSEGTVPQKYAGSELGRPFEGGKPSAGSTFSRGIGRFSFNKLSLPIAIVGGGLAVLVLTKVLSLVLGLAFAGFVIYTVFRFADRTVNREYRYKERRMRRRMSDEEGEREDDFLEDFGEDLARHIKYKIKSKIKDKFKY